MHLEGINWNVAIEQESWGLEVSLCAKKHRRAYDVTVITAGQSASSCELHGKCWVAVNITPMADSSLIAILCRDNISLYYYTFSVPFDRHSPIAKTRIEPTWQLCAKKSIFANSVDMRSQANTALAILLTNTCLDNLRLDAQVIEGKQQRQSLQLRAATSIQ